MRSFFPVFLLVRIVAVSLYLCGMALLVFPVQELFFINPINWHEDFVRKNSQWKKSLQTLTALTDESYTSGDDLQKRFDIELSEYIEKKTKNFLIDVSGQEWEGFFAELAAGKNGTEYADSAWKNAAGYFKPAMSPLNTIRDKFNDEKDFFYVRVTGTDKTQEYMTLSLEKPHEFFFKAPANLVFSQRNTGFWLILAGILTYLIQSGQALPKRQVRLGYEKTSRGPDLVAALFAPVFIFIAAGVNAQIGLRPLSHEWFLVSGIFWFFAALFATSWLFTAYYRSFSIDYSDHAIVCNTLFGSSEYEISRIRELRPTQYQNPWWMKALLSIGRLTARGNSSRQYYADKPEPGCKIVTSDDSGPTICTAGLYGLSDFYADLESRGIYVDEILKINAKSIDAEKEESPWFITRVFAKVAALAAIGVAALGIVSTFSLPDPQIKSKTLPATPFSTLKTAGPSREELEKKVQRNAEQLEQVNKLGQQIQELSDRMEKTTDPEVRKQLTAESDLIMQKLMELRNQQ